MHSVVLFYGLVIIFACKADPLQQVVKGNLIFTENVYKKLIQTQKGNIIFSGLSAEIILSLLTNGAKGTTQSQLITALNLPNNQKLRDQAFKQVTESLNINSDKIKLLSANKIYPAKDFSVSETFKNTAVDVYHSDVENLDYTNAQLAANTINKWVEEHTNGKIKNLIDPSQLNAATVLVLVNALYFSGDWVHPFEKYNTQKGPFYTSETKSKQIDLMSTVANVKYAHSKSLNAKFLELDFKNCNISMVFILPNEKCGLGAVENNFQKYLQPQNLEYVRVAITLPKFESNTKIDFVPLLQQFGATQVFTDQADLSGISSKGNLKVSFVLQKAFINVTETGVEAAAATAGGISLTSVLGPPPFSFNAVHSFIYYIRDRSTGIILFVGRFSG